MECLGDALYKTGLCALDSCCLGSRLAFSVTHLALGLVPLYQCGEIYPYFAFCDAQVAHMPVLLDRVVGITAASTLLAETYQYCERAMIF